MSEVKLSILIPSIESRASMLARLLDEINRQIDELDVRKYVQVLIEIDEGYLKGKRIETAAFIPVTIGEKRNKLLQNAEGKYLCFIDDDDKISKDYLKNVLEGIDKDVDCVSLRGVITWNGTNPELFEHSIKYDAYRTNDTGAIKYERFPNHLNVIRSSIAKQFRFPSTNHGEDYSWAEAVHRSGLIRTEHYIDEVIYHYDFIPNK